MRHEWTHRTPWFRFRLSCQPLRFQGTMLAAPPQRSRPLASRAIRFLPAHTMKTFHCNRCNQLVFFENTHCENCGAKLGYVPELTQISAFDETEDGAWK